jgi:hypothetical protein
MCEWHPPPPTPSQALKLRMDADERDIAEIGKGTLLWELNSLIARCAVQFVESKHIDAQVGGNEFERRAYANLLYVTQTYTSSWRLA